MNKELLEQKLQELADKTNESIEYLYRELIILTEQTLKDLDYDTND